MDDLTPDELADRLAEIGAQLVARVREDDPEAYLRWLRAMVAPGELEALCIVLAAAVPTNQTWLQLTAWTSGETSPRLRPCGTLAAYARHRARRQQPCEPCMEVKRAYDRKRIREKRAKAVDKPVDNRLVSVDATVDGRNSQSLAPQGIYADRRMSA